MSRTIYVLASVEIPALLLPLAHNWAAGEFGPVWVLALLEVVLLAVLGLNQAGRSVAAGRLLCLGNWALVIALCAVGDSGTHDVVLFLLPSLLMVAGLLFDMRFYLAFAALVLASVAALVLAEISGVLVTPMGRFSDFRSMADLLLILVFTATAVALLVRDIRHAFLRARRDETALAANRAELERQAETLRGSEHRLRTAMELAVEGVAHADAAGRIVQANTRAAEITGYRPEELVGRNFIDFFSAEELVRTPVCWDVLDRGEVVNRERRLTRKDGTVIDVEMSSQRLPDRSLQCFIRDITSRRAREEQLRQRQRLEALGTLAGGVAHDFNNLLTVMHGALDTIEAAPEQPQALQGPLLDLRSATARARELTQQLLAFARRQPLERRRCDLRDVVAENIRMLGRLLGPQIELVMETAAERCPVMADPGMLSHVLLNLAVNARDAMPGGGRLTVGARVVQIENAPRATADDCGPRNFVRLRVADSGVGMDEATRRRLFEPFFTTKPEGKGTGLGLSVSLGIVEQHGGWIDVESRPGAGSEFLVYLPVCLDAELAAVPAAAAAPTAALPAPAVRGTETLLVVEDEEPVRRLAVGALQWCGFDVLEAANGREAMALWKQHSARIALLLTDVAMPGGMSGVDVLMACRADRPKLPVIVNSGYSQDSVGLDESQWADIRFLPKPYSMSSLAKTVREAIDKRQPG